MLRVISLGAGVQSTTMALMAAKDEISPMPDCAIFADTGWEPQSVYNHLKWLMSPNILPFPVHIVSAGNLRNDILERSRSATKRIAAVPWFMKMPNGDDSIGRRQCTTEYKIAPIRRKIRELLGNKTRKGSIELLIGISTDEAMRMKPSKVGYIINRWPLIEQKFNRNDCLQWLKRNGYPTAPKSSCIGCPFHNDHQWREIRKNPVEWQDAIQVDEAIRQQPGFNAQQFMHRSLKPLSEVDLRTDAEIGQADLFNNECEGMCGV